MRTLKFLVLAAAVAVSLHAKAPTKMTPEMKTLKAEMMKNWKAHGAAAHKVTKGMTDQELIKWMKDDKDFILLDVREPDEVAIGTIASIDFMAIPRGMVAPMVGKAAKLNPKDTIVIYCKKGIRSAFVARELEEYYGFKNVYYLKGGITGWVKNGHEMHTPLGEFVIAK
ncbi:MAG: rhodanese-like domain-containing protein [Sulfurovum sp.]|nr:rhodanese-like domain-containing protein [Sulfurovum sp.]